MCADPDCHEPIHHRFGLSYASYLVMQRSVLQAMPLEWQHKFCALLAELHDAAAGLSDRPDTFQVTAKRAGKYVTDPYSEYRRSRIRMVEGKMR